MNKLDVQNAILNAMTPYLDDDQLIEKYVNRTIIWYEYCGRRNKIIESSYKKCVA